VLARATLVEVRRENIDSEPGAGVAVQIHPRTDTGVAYMAVAAMAPGNRGWTVERSRG
jgi:hypothetical protein